MIYSSFGGLLKDFRIRKNLTQQEIAYAMGWSEPSRLSRIEQGSTKKPAREMVDKLITLMKLDRAEKGQLLYAGGYLPTKEEIENMRKEVRSLLDQWPYPAYLLDFAWRMIVWNKQAGKIYQITGSVAEKVLTEIPSSLEITFSPEFMQNKYLSGKEEIQRWHNVLLAKLVRFRLLHKGRTSEKWYQDFMSRMMKNELFANLWQKAQHASQEHGIANYESKGLVDVSNIKRRFEFHILRSPLLQDMRFEINYHIPGDTETFVYFTKT